MARLAAAGIDLQAGDERVARLLEEVKQRSALGYAYDGAEASFELLALRALGRVPDYFDIESYSVTVERRGGVTLSEGIVHMSVGGEKLVNVGSGNGPVNALDAALRKDLGKYHPSSPICAWWITKFCIPTSAIRRSPASWSKASMAKVNAGPPWAFRRISSMPPLRL